MPSYNNYFPVGYQPYQMSYQQPFMTPQQITPQPTQTNSSGIVWVQGEAGAKAYPVAPGTSLLLMDSEREQFYLKSTDVSGMPMPLRLFTYKEVVAQPTTESSSKNEVDLSNYITREELDSRLNALKMSTGRRMKKEETQEDE